MNVIHQEATKAEAPAGTSAEPEVATAPRPKLLTWLALAAAIATGGYFYLDQPDSTPAAPPAVERLPAGQFRLNENEMRALRIEPVVSREFRPERLAEGRIAYNDDRSTPMLSPANTMPSITATAGLT